MYRIVVAALLSSLTCTLPGQSPSIREITVERLSKQLVVEDSGLRVGRVAIEYASEPWTHTSAAEWRKLPHHYRAIGGSDSWCELILDVTLRCGHNCIEPGRYYLGLGFEDDAWELLLFDPTDVNERNITRRRVHELEPAVVELTHTLAADNAPLAIELHAQSLEIAFGPHRLATALEITLPHHGLPNIGERLPEDIAEWIETADKIELLALEPERKARPREGKDAFHGYAVRGRKEVPVATTGWDVRREVYEGIRLSDGSVADCFEPRHGVRVHNGKNVIDLVICYACLQMSIHVSDGVRLSVPTSQIVRTRMNTIYRAAGLDIAR